MDELVALARRFAEGGSYLFFKHGAHFCNPLVAQERERLETSDVPADEGVRRVVDSLLKRQLEPGIFEPGIYSPVPIARGVEAGDSIESLLERFRYEMIVVDEDQEWWWNRKTVAPRIRTFFTEHLAYEADIDRYYFEYRVNPEWFDKSYFEALVTPMVARFIEEGDGTAEADLNNGRRDRVDLESFRLDDRERLFCSTFGHGEVLLTDALRFSLLKEVSEDCQRLLVAGSWRPLSWPPGV